MSEDMMDPADLEISKLCNENLSLRQQLQAAREERDIAVEAFAICREQRNELEDKQQSVRAEVWEEAAKMWDEAAREAVENYEPSAFVHWCERQAAALRQRKGEG